MTIHDVIPERHPQWYPRGNPHKVKRKYYEAADLVFVVSESTKAELLETFGAPTGQLRVVPLGVGSEFTPGLMPLEGLPENYVLFVGDRGLYKNFEVVLKAFSRGSTLRELSLVILGPPLSPEERRELHRLGLSRQVFQAPRDNASLARAYANAGVFIFPSLYEGFGLPTLEAMASGCPALLSHIPTFNEVGGDAAIYFDPHDEEEVAHKIALILGDRALRQSLIQGGLERATRYTWQRTAKATVTAYEMALD